MPTQNAAWREYGLTVPGPSSAVFHYYQHFINGDTTIQGMNYHKIYKSGYDNGINVNYYYSDLYQGAIREDSAKKVYWFNGTTETLLYDFNVQLGDTLQGMFGTIGYNFTYWVGAIDSILVSGNYHKRYCIVMDPSLDTASYIIEGIGSTAGLFGKYYGDYFGGYFRELICFMQNGITAYPDGYNCVMVGLDDSKSATDFKVFPNPSSGLIHIKNIPSDYSKLQVINILGEIVYQSEVNNQELQLDLGYLQKGIYSIMLFADDGATSINKIVLH